MKQSQSAFMLRKGDAFLVLSILILSMAGGILITGDSEAAPPVFSSVAFDPEDPSFEDEINVSATFLVADEAITGIDMQVCHNNMDGTGGLCEAPITMTDSGDGGTFYAFIPSGGYGTTEPALLYSFHFFVDYGSSGSFIYPADLDSHELNVTVVRKATMITVDADADSTTVYPNETITVSGKVKDDLDENVTGAKVNLTVDGEAIENTTTTDIAGEFSLSVSIPSDGSYTLNLTVDKDGMMAYEEWEVTVNSWPIPDMELTADLGNDGEDIPIADPYEFYTGANLTIDFSVNNRGTGTAFNVTVIVNITGREDQKVQSEVDLAPHAGFGSSVLFNTSVPDDYTVTITVEYDQEAPEIYRQPYDPVVINITIRDPPTWEDHRVLVEMFTQTTCGPCVYVEEALERLYNENILDFDFIMYVYDDVPSQAKATELGVTSTPDMFVDHTYDRMKGGDEQSFLDGSMRTDLISMIENASARDTPPVDIMITTETESLNISLGLGSVYTEDISGILQVQRVETHSNMRNMEGIPIAHRFLETISTRPISDLSPGNAVHFSIPLPNEGEGIVAVLYDDMGKVLQSTSYLPGAEPEVYIKEGSDLLRIGSPGEELVNLTIERFQFDDSPFDDIIYTISTPDLPEGWNLTLGDVKLGDLEYDVTFSGDVAENGSLDSTRVRFWDNVSLTVEVPDTANGTYSFHIDINSSGHFFRWSVVVIATPKELPDTSEDPSIDNVYMEMDGEILYIFVEASNVPPGAIVKARILPCDYGENAACGLPFPLVLDMYEIGKYRADASEVDLKTYTHLTYNAWIEKDGEILLGSDEETAEISVLIGHVGDDDDNDDGDDNILIFVAIASIVLVVIIVMIVIMAISRKKRDELTTSGTDDEE